MEAKPALAHRWDGWGGIGGTAKWQSDIQHHQAPPSLGGFGMDIYTYSQGGVSINHPLAVLFVGL